MRLKEHVTATCPEAASTMKCHQPREPWATVSGQTCSLCPGPHTCSLHQKYRVCTVLDRQGCQGARERPALGCSDTTAAHTSTGCRTSTGSQQQEQPPAQLVWSRGRVPSIKQRAFYHLPVTPLMSKHVIKNLSLLPDLMSSA